MGKIKKEDNELTEFNIPDASKDFENMKNLSYEDKLRFVNCIAKPMAPKKLVKRISKLVRKGARIRNIRNGYKAVQTRLRRGERGLVVFAGDTHPIELMCHLPAVCEEKELPYVYVPSNVDLSIAAETERGQMVVLIKPHETYEELYNECIEEVSKLPPAY